MATLSARFMATLDRWAHHHFQMSYCRSGDGKGGRYETYWSGFGKKFAIVRPDGTVIALGNSWWIRHHYDANGNLVGRRRMVKTAEPEDRVVFGFEQVYHAYATQPRPWEKFRRFESPGIA